MQDIPKCEPCGVQMVPIIYGLPSPDDFEKEQQGEFVLGGCVVYGDDPQWACPTCGKQE